MIPIIYTTTVCPKCQRLKAFLLNHKIKFLSQDMGAPENLTELVFNGVYSRSAPVLRVGSTFLTSDILFIGVDLQEKTILDLVKR